MKGRDEPGVGVVAVVIQNERLLMVKRAGAHGAGTWSIPGGWVEHAERWRHAAEREVFEETGVVCAGQELLSTTESFFIAERIHCVTLFIRCEYVTGEAKVVEPAKCPEVEWVPVDEVADRDLFDVLGHYWNVERLGVG